MIGQITGSVSAKGDNFLIVQTNSGVGYKVFGTTDLITTTNAGQEISLFTHLAVRENSLDLYGFLQREDLSFFELIINSISGIGPKKALSILSVAPVQTIRQAVISGDSSYLTKVSGIGQKNAEKIVLELKDKLGKVETNEITENLNQDQDVLEAIVALGYSSNQARDVLRKISKTTSSVNEKIKEALKILGKR